MAEPLVRAVLVTGAGSGIGKTTVRYLASRNFFVYATDMDEESLKDFQDINNISSFVMDVTNSSDIANGLKIIKNKGHGLFAIVNNAGISRMSPALETPIEELRQLLDVNTIAPLEITKAFKDLIFESNGRIVVVGSAATRFVAPFHGPYSASKLAVEGLFDALRRELHPYKIKVIIIQPGPTDTPIWDKTYPKDEYNHTIYEERLNQIIRKERTQWQVLSQSPTILAKSTYRVLIMKRPKSRYFISKNKFQQIFISKVPTGLADWLLARYY